MKPFFDANLAAKPAAKMDTRLLHHRRWMAGAMQVLVSGLALAASFLLRFDFALEPRYGRMLWEALPLVVAVKLAVFRSFGLSDLPWRYLGFRDLIRIAWANLAASAAATLGLRLVLGPAFPRSIQVIDLLVCWTLAVAARTGIKLWLDRADLGATPLRRVLIYGAGQAGSTLANEIQQHPAMGYQVAGFLDDDPSKRSLRVHGERVWGGLDELARAARALRASEVLIALPTISGSRLTAILEQCRAAEVPARRVPALAELLGERSLLVHQIRNVRLEDLIGRPPVQLRPDAVRRRLAGRVVLVTGAGGSIGSELCRQIARYSPAAIVGFDHGETALYDIEQELAEAFPDVDFYPAVGSLRDRRRLREVFRDHRPQTVYHAAAYKHVPMMEAHLFEAVENNVFGTRQVARAALAAGCEEFVLVSSDKAVRPANVMGATKRLAELVCLGMRPGRSPDMGPDMGPGTSLGSSPDTASGESTRFVAVRFGNVLGSSGSVIPRFRRQIARGGPVTVTHPEMRRFFMTIPEAAQLVLEAAAMGAGGEVFVLEMGEPVRISDLARKMVLLSGLRPDEDIQIVYSGVRPGEKLFEELHASGENLVPTPHRQIRVFAGGLPLAPHLEDGLRTLRQATEARDAAGVVMCLKGLVPEYNPSAAVLRQAFSRQTGSQPMLSQPGVHPRLRRVVA
ncbi:MAG TPA: nucleoside-diphosphate sugar epimerase/dehydratase [Bryobacteraceae bacterium]|nr:nucleoside-diphosphate sugar epimerase/dehydratase [Bryobacteraceae bacterium]